MDNQIMVQPKFELLHLHSSHIPKGNNAQILSYITFQYFQKTFFPRTGRKSTLPSSLTLTA